MEAVSQPRPLRAAFLCAGAATALFLLAFLPRSETGLTIGLVAVFGGVCAIPWAVSSLGGRKEPFDLLHMVCILSFVQFGLGTLYLLYDPGAAYDRGVYQYLNVSMAYCIVGMASLIYGYYLGGRLRAPVRRAPMAVRGELWIAAVFLIGFCAQLLDVQASRAGDLSSTRSGLLSFLQQFIPFALFAYFLLVYLFFSRLANLKHKALLVGVVVPAELAILALSLGNKSFFMIFLGIPIVAFRYARGRMPWSAVLVSLLIIVFAVFPFYNMYRNTNNTSSMGTRVGQTLDRLGGLTPQGYGEQSLYEVGRRVALVNSVAVIVRETGSSVEYAHGRTIGLALVSILIPRAVWPDKPVINLGREFAREFRIQPRHDDRTWVAVTAVGELYWNFGLAGVLAGMLALGLALRFIYGLLGEQMAANPVRMAAYVSLFLTLLGFDGNLAAWLGATVKAVTIYLLLEAFLRRLGLLVPAAPSAITAET